MAAPWSEEALDEAVAGEAAGVIKLERLARVHVVVHHHLGPVHQQQPLLGLHDVRDVAISTVGREAPTS